MGRAGHAGGWDSDAGRLVLAVHTAYWARDATRAEEADCLLLVADGRVAVRAAWQDASEVVSCAHAGVRATHGRDGCGGAWTSSVRTAPG